MALKEQWIEWVDSEDGWQWSILIIHIALRITEPAFEFSQAGSFGNETSNQLWNCTRYFNYHCHSQ
jgi:hypothetical protein